MKNREDKPYLERPYWKATLGEHRAARENTIHRELRQFLEADPSDVDQQASQQPTYDLPHLHHAIAACFPEWTLEMELGSERGHGIGGASRVRWEVAPDKWGDFVDNGNLLYRLPDGGARIISLVGPFCEHRGDMYEMTVTSRRADRKQVDSEIAALQKWLRENHYLRGQAIRANGTLFPKSSVKSWDDISLPEPILEAVVQNTVGLLERREMFVKYGVPQKRGILLHGPPGTGKTMVGIGLLKPQTGSQAHRSESWRSWRYKRRCSEAIGTIRLAFVWPMSTSSVRGCESSDRGIVMRKSVLPTWNHSSSSAVIRALPGLVSLSDDVPAQGTRLSVNAPRWSSRFSVSWVAGLARDRRKSRFFASSKTR